MVCVHLTLLFGITTMGLSDGNWTAPAAPMAQSAVFELPPFQGSAEARFVRSDPPYEFIHLTGLATHFGAFEGMRTVRNMGRTTVATTTLAGAGGDSISIYSEITWDKHFLKASGFFVVTDGTGRFQDATGYGVESVGPFDPAIGARTLAWDGFLDF